MGRDKETIRKEIDLIKSEIKEIFNKDIEGKGEEGRADLERLKELSKKEQSLFEELFKDLTLPKDVFKGDRKVCCPKTLGEIKSED